MTNIGSSVFTVGSADSGGGDENFLMEKFDEAGNVVWKTIAGGTGNDGFNGVVSVGGRLYASGFTASDGAGGEDSVLAEIDPNTGAILSETLFGGARDDAANGIATDGQNLFIVGETRSFAAPDGNAVGENDGILLRYAIPTTSVSIDGSGNLAVTDVAGGGKDDNLTVSYNAANKQYVLTDPTAVFSTAIGATNGPNEVDVPAADVTGKIEVNTGAGNDTLTVNYKHLPAGGLNYDGGTGDNSLKVNNATAKARTKVVHKGH